ncbi:FMN-binding protein [Actimicrobium sp. CCI2.3]|uniref:FMN-binding protein n=1 Tax=Actimicrobium sp. CCI2.3 TaxID=3048616 RepID=UPI002AB3CFEF|nr:FMN-binding protein [Actimicrobium sp. CCI2.3]MDY7573622.1 FMN-binding protein [Actimicrobium sp. CCI2.3]MEB0021107.1 FMN-binding protein [Actimicrobium sp. CCI2.3]
MNHATGSVLLGCTLLASGSAFATQYLTAEEARQVLFADATAFKAQPLELSAAQMREVQQLAGLPARSVQWRVMSAWRGEMLLGYVVLDDVIGKYELISYAVALNPDATVRQIEILTYRESHGFEIRSPAWRKQFVGKSAQSGLTIGEGISNISGATLSSNHVTDGVRRIAAVVQVALKK